MTRLKSVLVKDGVMFPSTGRWCFACGEAVWNTDGTTEYCAECESETIHRTHVRREM